MLEFIHSAGVMLPNICKCWNLEENGINEERMRWGHAKIQKNLIGWFDLCIIFFSCQRDFGICIGDSVNVTRQAHYDTIFSTKILNFMRLCSISDPTKNINRFQILFTKLHSKIYLNVRPLSHHASPFRTPLSMPTNRANY